MIPPSTRLRRALHLRSPALVRRILLSHSENPTLVRNADPDGKYNTSLHLAALLGLPEVAELLLSLGHEDEGTSRNIDGVTPLMLALQAGDDESDPVVAGRIAVGRVLMQRFPQSIIILDKKGMNALHHLSRHGTVPLLNSLLSLSLPHTSDSDPFSTLTQPSKSQPHHLLNTPDSHGDTPLHHASAAGHLKCVRQLIDAGADPSAKNSASWTPLDYSFSVAAEVYLRNLMRERGIPGPSRAGAGVGVGYMPGAGGGSGGSAYAGSVVGSPTKSGVLSGMKKGRVGDLDLGALRDGSGLLHWEN